MAAVAAGGWLLYGRHQVSPQASEFGLDVAGADQMDARKLVSEIARKNVVMSSNGNLLADIDGWDSLKGVRLVLRLQEIVGRELSEDDIAGLQSIADVEKVLQSAG